VSLLVRAFLAAVEALASVVDLIRESGTEEEREALLFAAERIASIHAKAKFPGLVEP
jgi:hypothetical protein